MAKNRKTNTITIHNIKNSLYRQVHIDGAQGGITPSGFININFFSQRGVIPKGTEFEVNDEGQITRPIKDIDTSKHGIVREFEFGTYMDINACKNLKEFLERKIDEYNNIVKKQ